MTLIAAASCPQWSLMVSDRLTTVREDVYDAHANKNVVVLASDGSAIVGFTGAAYIREVPTDEWIAHHLSFERFPLRDSFAAASFYGRAFHLSLTGALYRLRAALRRSGYHRHVRIVIVGHRFRRGRMIAFSQQFGVVSNAAEQQLNLRPLFPGNGAFAFAGANVSQADLQAAMAGSSHPPFTYEHLHESFAKLIRAKAATEPTVGDDLMYLTVAPIERIVRAIYEPGTRFEELPEREKNAAWHFLLGPGEKAPRPAATPCFVSRVSHVRPLVVFGVCPAPYLGDWDVQISGGPTYGKIMSQVMGLHRRPAPRR